MRIAEVMSWLRSQYGNGDADSNVLERSMMTARKWLLRACVFAGLVAFGGRPNAQGPTAAFHAVGDLPGGASFSIIKDATRVGGVIYAVGGGVDLVASPFPDTAVVWRSDGTNPPTLAPLPDLVTNTTATSRLTAYAITPDAAYIASQARSSATSAARAAVRVTTSSLTNLNLSAFPPSTASPVAAVAMSSDGTILYGFRQVVVSGVQRLLGVRIDTLGATNSLVPFVDASDTDNPVADRGSSADGSVAVGSSFSTAANHKAYRYVQGSGVAAIPFLTGGTFNDAVAISPDGDLVLATGNSGANPNGEAYLYRASTGGIQPLGSPNTLFSPGVHECSPTAGCQPVIQREGGMTADGSVVAMNFWGDAQHAYFRNSHGWFHLESALAAHGIDIAADGWRTENIWIQGMSADGTLVFGAGEHNGNIEGFVAEFGAGVLASFNPQPVPPANTSIVGVWATTGDPNNPRSVLVFTADGVYYHINGAPGNPQNGFERGYYTFDGSNVVYTTLLDTNGSTGVSRENGSDIPFTITGDTEGFRLAGIAGTLVGGWTLGNPTQRDSSAVIVFTPGGQYLFAQDGSGTGSGRDSIEIGTFTWDANSGLLAPNVDPSQGGLDGNGDGGLYAGPGLTVTANLTANGLAFLLDGGSGALQFDRVIDPATIPVITNAQLSASGTVGQTFRYDVTATNTTTFGASGLPDGLSISSATGAIAGMPNVGGQFAVTLSAMNAAGVSDFKTLVVTIAIPTPVGQNVVVEPEVPAGQGPVTMTFADVTSAGTTTVTTVDLDQSGIPLPGNVDVGGVVYEVQTTAQYTGLIQLCFSYAGIDFGTATPRLFHYENNQWVDITTSVDTNTQTICGATTSLSPFAVLVSHVVRTGFYAPVNPIAGFLNTVKGASTVPLKFNVFVDGIEKKTTDGLQFTVQTISCDSTAPLDPVDFTVAGETSLRYDPTAGYFIQNWKVPKTPGCYMVRMTTQQDALALTARFKVK